MAEPRRPYGAPQPGTTGPDESWKAASSLGGLSLGGRWRFLFGLARRVDAHRVEATPYEDDHDGKADGSHGRRRFARDRMLRVVGQLDRQEAEERRELDDGVHRHAARV